MLWKILIKLFLHKCEDFVRAHSRKWICCANGYVCTFKFLIAIAKCPFREVRFHLSFVTLVFLFLVGFSFCQSDGRKVASHYGFNFFPPNTKKIMFLFKCLLSIYISSSVNFLFTSSGHSSMGCISLIIWRSSIYILDTDPLNYVYYRSLLPALSLFLSGVSVVESFEYWCF